MFICDNYLECVEEVSTAKTLCTTCQIQADKQAKRIANQEYVEHFIERKNITPNALFRYKDQYVRLDSRHGSVMMFRKCDIDGQALTISTAKVPTPRSVMITHKNIHQLSFIKEVTTPLQQ